MKKFLPFIFLLLAIVVLYLLAGQVREKKTVWEESYGSKDKNPYGSFLIYHFRQVLFPGKEVERVTHSPYQILQGEHPGANYIFINRIFDPSYQDAKALLDFVQAGNNVWVSAERYYGPFSNKFDLQTDIAHEIEDSVTLNFTNPALHRTEDYAYEKGSVPYYFSTFRKDSAVILGKSAKNKVHFLKIGHGEGNFYLNTTPRAFTNYHILVEGNISFPFKALSYLPVADTYWDEYYKKSSRVSQSPLMVIKNSNELRWAYYLMIASLALFVLFRAKRTQRIIPVIKPLPNTTLQFVRTVGNLYFHKGTHHDIALKKILYFKDYLRSNFYLTVNELDDELAVQVARKSGIPVEEVKALFHWANKIQASKRAGLKQLIRLNELIEDFYGKTK